LLVVTLLVGLVATAIMVVTTVSSRQLLVPRNAPFGMVGSSQVVAQAQTKVGLDIIAYPNQSAAMHAAEDGALYGAYVTGSASDTLIVVPSRSFFAWTEIEPAFLDAAHMLSRPVTVQTVKPLPSSDNIGAVVSILLIPLLVGSYLCTLVVFVSTKTARERWRWLVLPGFAIVGAVLTDVIAGPLIGAYSGSHFWTLLPCFALAGIAVVLTSAAIQAMLGPPGMLLAFLFIVPFNGGSAGGLGVYLLPVYWRNIGVTLPSQNAGTLISNVLYFGGNGISTALIVLFLYVLGAGAIVWHLGRTRAARPPQPVTEDARRELAKARVPGDRSGNPSSPAPGDEILLQDDIDAGPEHGSVMDRLKRPIVLALLTGLVLECVIGAANLSAGHQPVATNLPFGVTGSSPILTAAQKNISLAVTHYPNESAATTAIDQFKIWGALVPASTAGSPSTLIVVPSSSDLAPLDLAARFEQAAKTTGQKLTVQEHAPVALAAKDPFGLVPYLGMLPLLVCGFMIVNLLASTTGMATRRWRAATLTGYAIIAGLVSDLILTYWLQGFPSNKFWIVWPICSLIIAVIAFVSAVFMRLLGIPGSVLWLIVLFFFGNPSSGGTSGVPYLPAFWRDIGPYLPPRNGLILLHQTIYFNGHGITQALAILLGYLVVVGAILVALDWLRPARPASEEDAQGGAALAGAGGVVT
jgi:hypothetical protein